MRILSWVSYKSQRTRPELLPTLAQARQESFAALRRAITDAGGGGNETEPKAWLLNQLQFTTKDDAGGILNCALQLFFQGLSLPFTIYLLDFIMPQLSRSL